MGEAANQLLPETRESIRSIPWSQVIGMRNRLIHGYFSINLDYLWDTVEVDLPPLIDSLDHAIGG